MQHVAAVTVCAEIVSSQLYNVLNTYVCFYWSNHVSFILNFHIVATTCLPKAVVAERFCLIYLNRPNHICE